MKSVYIMTMTDLEENVFLFKFTIEDDVMEDLERGAMDYYRTPLSTEEMVC